MRSLNHDLDRLLLDADGIYLDDKNLRSLEQYTQTFTHRLTTYELLRESAPLLVQHAVHRMSQTEPQLIQQHGQRCMYDMTEVLRYAAIAILRDDEVFFKEHMSSWLDTVLVAHKRNEHCAMAYRFLQEIIQAKLPQTSNVLIRPHLEGLITLLQSHAQH